MFAPDPSGESAAVVVTHGMIGAMLQGLTQAWPFLERRPPEIVGALPWSRAFGGNVVLRARVAPRRDAARRWTAPCGTIARRGRADAGVRPADGLGALGRAAACRRRAAAPLAGTWISRAGAERRCSPSDARRAARDRRSAGRRLGLDRDRRRGVRDRRDDPVFDAIGAPLAGVEIALHPAGDAYEARVRGAAGDDRLLLARRISPPRRSTTRDSSAPAISCGRSTRARRSAVWPTPAGSTAASGSAPARGFARPSCARRFWPNAAMRATCW